MSVASFNIENLNAFLNTFKNELSKTQALLLLNQKIQLFEKDFLLNPTEAYLPLFIELKREKIYLEFDLEIRIQLWTELFEVLEKNKKVLSLGNYSIEYGKAFDTFIDDIYFHQCASLLSFNLPAKVLSLIKKFGDLIKIQELKQYEFDFLLLRSIFLKTYCRYFLKGNKAKDERWDKISEAERCLSRAGRIDSNSPNLYIANGYLLFYKATSDLSLSEKDYQKSLDEIENEFLRAINISKEPSFYLVLLQFYRNTYQFQKCCDLFISYSHIENNKRRLLRYSYLIGESLASLYEQNWPNEYIDKILKYSLEIHSECIDAGYTNPRIYLSKASLLAIKGDDVLSSTFIFRIFKNDGTFSWDQVISFSQIITEETDEALIEQKRAIKKGINNGYFWNSLGTYAKIFLQDIQIAYEFYETARLLSSNNAVIYNNLAKTLIEINPGKNQNEIKEYLEKAERYANKRFQWWKITKERFLKLCTELNIETKDLFQFRRKPKLEESENESLLEQLHDLRNNLNYSKRGTTFEKIMENFISRLCPISTFNYKLYYGEDNNFHEIDSVFSIGSHSYIGEFFYSNSPAPKSEISDLNVRLKGFSNETRGILFSFSGFDNACINFTKETIKDSHPIILIDGDEISDILRYNCLQQVLEYKIEYVNTLRNPYSKYPFSKEYNLGS